jgi:hypothetical protein
MGIKVGVGFTGIGVGLGGGDVLVGPSLAALIVGSIVCDADGCEKGEHADKQSSMMPHKVQMRRKNHRSFRTIDCPLIPNLQRKWSKQVISRVASP